MAGKHANGPEFSGPFPVFLVTGRYPTSRLSAASTHISVPLT